MRFRLLLITSLFLAMSAAAEPPARVVRLNLTDGPVSFRPAGIDEWTDAIVNRPLIDGDELWTDSSSRAELHIGSAAVRLDGGTAFGIVRATDDVAQLRLSSGTMTIRVRRVEDDSIWEIDTPNAVVSLLRPGRYRVDVSEDGLTTAVTTRGGEAEVNAADDAFPVRAGEQATITGDGDLTHEVDDAPAADAFDRWCSNRDVREDRVASLHYIPADLVGYEDLDANGHWRFVSDYGWVWTPNYVVAGWAPYRYGHWAWVEPWGWTWIDDAPWGFAPFHYGRWAFDGGVWFWVPGRVTRPVYAPALVVFGGRPGRAGTEVGTVAWWPLAPGEAYVPSYRTSQAYVRNINAPFVSGNVDLNVTNVRYRNQRVAGGVTAVSQATFVAAKPIAPSRISINASEAIAARPIGTAAPVAPIAASVTGKPAVTWNAARPPERITARPVVSKTTPPPPPVSFGSRQHVVPEVTGQPQSPEIESPKPKTHVARPAIWNTNPTPAPTTTTAPPTRTVTPPPTRTTPNTTTTPPPSSGNVAPSWRRATGQAPVTTTTTTSSSSGSTTSAKKPEKKVEKEKAKPEEKKKERKGEKND